MKFPSIPFWTIIVVMAIIGFVMEFVKVAVGYFDFKKGIWKVQAEWHQKKDVISPHNVEMRKTLKAICKKLGIPHHFKEL